MAEVKPTTPMPGAKTFTSQNKADYSPTTHQAESQKAGILGILDTKEHFSKCKDWGTFCENHKECCCISCKIGR